jgi:two-component system nitrogen regulation sensor histidine kinase NtrY
MLSRVSLRAKIVSYLVLIHLTLGAVAWFVLSKERYLLIAAEALFAVSVVLGVLLVRAFFVPLRLIGTGAQLMREQDFTTHFREVGQPELDELIRIYNDMAEKLRQERLRAEEQHGFLEKILQASPAGVVTLDYDGRVSMVSPAAARFLETDEASLRGRFLRDLHGPLAESLGGIGLGETRVVVLAGRRRLRGVHAQFYDHGHPRSFFLLEELTEELRASEREAYEKLIRMITHEVNNSVGAVRSLLESLGAYGHQIRENDRGDFTGGVSVAVARMNNLNQFMRGFAEVVRLPDPEPRPCDVKRLVDDILVLLRPELEARRISCAWECVDPALPILLDKNQIEQVLMNVLKNAVESIGEEGTIALTMARDGGRPVLTIRDSGSGFTDEVRARLFTPFFTTKREGRGLGLTVVQEILARHRFDFDLRPVPGGGAVFIIRF